MSCAAVLFLNRAGIEKYDDEADLVQILTRRLFRDRSALTFPTRFEQVADLENALELSCKALAEKVAVQTVAARLAEERDDALKELAELRQVS